MKHTQPLGNVSNPVCNLSDIARKELLKRPDISSMALSRLLVKKYPKLFTGIEQARRRVRYVRGAHGTQHRVDRKDAIVPRSRDDAEQCRKWGVLVPDSEPNPWGWRELPAKVNRWLVIADLHVPYHDKRAIEATLKHADGNCDGVLILGDLIDAYPLSFWCKDPRQRRFREEIETTKQVLDVLKQLKPKAIVWKGGNHEMRLERYLQQHAAEICDMPGLDYATWCDLDKKGVAWIDYMDPIRHHKLALIHGHEWKNGIISPVNPARGAYLKAHACVVVAHMHRASNHPEPDIFETVDQCWSIGCLCHDATTEVLTSDGWVAFPRVQDSDRIAEFTPQNSTIQFRIPRAIQCEPYGGNLIHFTGSRMNQCVTPEHKMLYTRSNAKLRIASAAHLSGMDRPHIPVCGYSTEPDRLTADEAAFACWVVTEGSLETVGRYQRMTIYQKKDNGVIAIRGLLKRLGVPHTEQEDPRNGVIGFRIGGAAWRAVAPILDRGVKRLPHALLMSSAHILNIAYDVLIQADGHRNTKGTDYFATISQSLADDFQIVCALTGRSCILRPTVATTNLKKDAFIFRCCVRKFRQAEVKASEAVEYSGNVYDLTTASGFFIVRRDGIVSVSGNCDLHPRYNPLANRWTTGFAYLNAGTEWSIENKTLIDGKVK
jgi:hypothetical protein